MPRKRTEHFHVVVEVTPPRWQALPDRIRYAGRTKSQAESIARGERDHRLPGNHDKAIRLERCAPPCQYDARNWPYGGDNVPEGKAKAYRAGPGWIEYADAKPTDAEDRRREQLEGYEAAREAAKVGHYHESKEWA
jgi:hypothetical protein